MTFGGSLFVRQWAAQALPLRHLPVLLRAIPDSESRCPVDGRVHSGRDQRTFDKAAFSLIEIGAGDELFKILHIRSRLEAGSIRVEIDVA